MSTIADIHFNFGQMLCLPRGYEKQLASLLLLWLVVLFIFEYPVILFSSEEPTHGGRSLVTCHHHLQLGSSAITRIILMITHMNQVRLH